MDTNKARMRALAVCSCNALRHSQPITMHKRFSITTVMFHITLLTGYFGFSVHLQIRDVWLWDVGGLVQVMWSRHDTCSKAEQNQLAHNAETGRLCWNEADLWGTANRNQEWQLYVLTENKWMEEQMEICLNHYRALGEDSRKKWTICQPLVFHSRSMPLRIMFVEPMGWMVSHVR